MEFLPLGGLCLYAPLIGFPSLRDDNADLPTCPFSISLPESKPCIVGFPLLGVPTLLQGFFPLKAPVWCSPNEIFFTWKHIVPYGLPSSDLRVDEPPINFFLQGPSRIATPLLGFFPLGVNISNLSTSCTPPSGPYRGHSSANKIFPTQK